MTPLNGKLYTKQALFVRQYLIDLNATKAAERAGYSMRTAYSQGQRLLQHAAVRDEIQTLMDQRATKLEITAERVLAELALIGFANMFDYIGVTENGGARVDLSKLTREQAAAIQEVTVEEFTERTGEDCEGKPIFENVRRTKFKLSDKRAALVDLGRHLKLFTDKVQLDGELQVEVQDVKQKLLAKLAGRAAASAAGS
jgi:phage terminase small subunit